MTKADTLVTAPTRPAHRRRVPFERAVRRVVHRLRVELAGRIGLLPNFLIVGAQKCGTTSLYDYLIEHESIHAAATKEVGYFDRYYARGLTWYRAQFPSRLRAARVQRARRQPFITGEASTGYILNPHALRRIRQVLPDVKLILLLRNPVDRAFSHYQACFRRGVDTLSFEAALESEESRIGAAWARMLADETFHTIDIAHYAYARTGLYAGQVEILLSLFPRDRVFVASTEAFAANPQRVYSDVLQFLGLADHRLADDTWSNVGQYAAMDPAIRAKLTRYFRPHNERLFEYLGTGFAWD